MKTILEVYINYLNEANKYESMLQAGKVAMKGTPKSRQAVLRSMMRPQSKMTIGKMRGLVNTAKSKGYRIVHDELANTMGPHINANTKELVLPTSWKKVGAYDLSHKEARKLKLATGPHERQEIIDAEKIKKSIKKSTGREPEVMAPQYGIGHYSARPPAVDAKETLKMSNQYGKSLQSQIVSLARDAETLYAKAPTNDVYLQVSEKELSKHLKELVDRYKAAEPAVKEAVGPELMKLQRKIKTAKSKLAADAYRKRYNEKVRKKSGLE